MNEQTPVTAEAPRHARDFLLRRGLNWLPLGLGYAALYMGRYNINVAQSALGETTLSRASFGYLFAIGAGVYSVSFLVNGPLTDRWGGRRTMLIGMTGAFLANLAMGCLLYGRALLGWTLPLFGTLAILYSVNMYFQSFAAAAIVTTKNPWFHVRERGRFSTVFGYMIALGIYLAFDWGYAIVHATRAGLPDDLGIVASAFHWLLGDTTAVNRDWWVFFVPATLIATFGIAVYALVRNTPAEAGYPNFDTGQEHLTAVGEHLRSWQLYRRILRHPVLGWVCLIEFCSGFIRNGSLQWFPKLAEAVGFKKTFLLTANWGLAMLVCGVVGGTLTGWFSDKRFASRRAPMVTILYGVMFVTSIAIAATVGSNPLAAGWLILLICTAVIGVHSIKAGTMTADFGGRNTGSAVAIIDGMVYLGTTLQSALTGFLVPVGEGAASTPAAWTSWALLFIPFALIGTLTAARIWHALPKPVAEHLRSRPTA